MFLLRRIKTARHSPKQDEHPPASAVFRRQKRCFPKIHRNSAELFAAPDGGTGSPSPNRMHSRQTLSVSRQCSCRSDRKQPYASGIELGCTPGMTVPPRHTRPRQGKHCVFSDIRRKTSAYALGSSFFIRAKRIYSAEKGGIQAGDTPAVPSCSYPPPMRRIYDRDSFSRLKTDSRF